MQNLDLKRQSRFVFKLALLIEIGVVLLGLGISVATALSALESQGSLTTLFVATSPFVMVALCELSKIPLAIAIWHSKKSKLLYLIFTLVVCFITFETLFNGFERNFAALTFSAKRLEIEKEGHQATITDNRDRIVELEQKYQDDKRVIEEKIADIVLKGQRQITEEKKSVIASNRALQEDQAALQVVQSELDTLTAEKLAKVEELAVKKQEALASRSKDLSSQQSIRQEQIRSIEKKIAGLNQSMSREMNEAFLSETKRQIRQEYQARIHPLQTQLNKLVDSGLMSEVGGGFSFQALDEQYALLFKMLDGKIATKQEKEQQLKSRIAKQNAIVSSSLAQKIDRIESHVQESLKEAKAELSQLDEHYAGTLADMEQIRLDNFKLKQAIRYLDSDIEQLYLSNQIYRLAAHIDGVERSADIKPSTLTLTALVWFGSLAFICAIIGPALVILSLHLSSKSKFPPELKAPLLAD